MMKFLQLVSNVKFEQKKSFIIMLFQNEVYFCNDYKIVLINNK